MAGEVTFDLVANTAKAEEAAERIQQKYEQALDRIGNASEKTSGVMDQMGQKIVTSVIGGASAFAAIEKAIDLATGALKKYHDENERGKTGLAADAMAYGALNAIAKNPADLLRMIAESEATNKQAGEALMPPAKAKELQVVLEKNSMQSSRSMFAELAGTVANPEALATGIAASKLTWDDQVGTVKAEVGKALLASRESKGNVTAEDITNVVTGLGPMAKTLGASKDETMAMVAALAPITQGAGEAGGVMSMLAKAAAKSSLSTTGGWEGLITAVEAKKLDIAGEAKLLGRGFIGFEKIQAALPDARRIDEAMSGGNMEGIVDDTIARRKGNPMLELPRQENIAATLVAEAEKDYGGMAATRRATAISQVNLDARASGRGTLNRYIEEAGAKAGAAVQEYTGIGTPEEQTRGGAEQMRQFLNPMQYIFDTINEKLSPRPATPAANPLVPEDHPFIKALERHGAALDANTRSSDSGAGAIMIGN